MKKTLGQNHKSLILVVLVPALVVGGYYFILFQLSTQIDQTTEILNQVAQEQEANQAVISIERTVAEVEGSLEKLETYFVAADGVVDFIEFVEELAQARDLGVDIKNVEIKTIVDQPYAPLAETLALRIGTLGSWQNTYNFLNQLENLPYQTEIFLAAIDRLDQPDEGLSWRGSFDLTVLKLK